VEAWTEWQPALAQSHALKPQQTTGLFISSASRRLLLGTLYIFRGNQALHSVSPVVAGVRINAIFTYNSQPNVTLSDYARKKFFGVDEVACLA